jgi:hypothetical protein
MYDFANLFMNDAATFIFSLITVACITGMIIVLTATFEP